VGIQCINVNPNHYGLYSLQLLPIEFLCVCWMGVKVFSIVLILLAGYEFIMKGGAPEGESLVHTTVLVDSGVYAVVRHPQYLGFILFVFALVLMSQHWLSVFSGVMGSALFYKDVLREEQMSIVKFGDEYKRYMQKVPRMNPLLGVMRLLNKKRE